MRLATVVIPVSPEHWAMGVYKQAVQSVEAQSLSTDYILVHDESKRGAGWARNVGSSQVTSPFLVYLDADDILHPDFVKRTVDHYRQGAFVYTDWILGGQERYAPPSLSPFEQGQQHIITTLLPTIAWKASGGFDETLPALEDEDFYRKLAAYGWCGIKCNGSLVTYNRNKGFSRVNRDANDQDIVDKTIRPLHKLFKERYGKFAMLYNCGQQQKQIQVSNKRENNDVLCEAQYSPMTQVGAVTKRLYPRVGNHEPLWVDIEDATARPDLFKRIAANPQTIAPATERIMELYKRALQQESKPIVATVKSNGTKPDYEAMPMTELWKVVKEKELDPIPTGKRNRYKKADLLKALA